jgi:hypothetical protein
VDQFEQHIRAVAGWPLGPTHALAQTEMLNLLGQEVDDWSKLAADPEPATAAVRGRAWFETAAGAASSPGRIGLPH